MIRRVVARIRYLAALTAAAGLVAAPAALADRPAGAVFSWGQELRQQKLPGWKPNRNPVSTPRWNRLVNRTLDIAGQNGLWFSGSAALPFDLPIRSSEPIQWFTPARYLERYQRTGLSLDVNLELRTATKSVQKHRSIVWDSRQKILTRRVSIIDPGYQTTALEEIRRIVPRYTNVPYRAYYTGLDEPMVFPPSGKSLTTPQAQRFVQAVFDKYGWVPPAAIADPTTDDEEGLHWLAFQRYVGDQFFGLKAQQAALIRSLDPNARISPADFGFIDGFIPWDYTRLGAFADVVELDPYVSFDEAENPGRGRYNPGFATKLMYDLTGRRIRTIVQAFPYNFYAPVPADLYNWTEQALRVGATDISLYGETNPRFRAPPVYQAMLDIARSLRGTSLPDPPSDPQQVVVYSTASEGQSQPELRDATSRIRTRANALYTTYSLLGELNHSSFVFDADTRLLSDPVRLARARTVWLPRGDTLDRPFAEELLDWVQSGGTLIVTDPNAFTRAPDGSSLGDVRSALVGPPLDARNHGQTMVAAASSLSATLPARALTLPLGEQQGRAFTQVPAGASVVARYADGAPAAILRTVGAGQVLAFAGDLMRPRVLTVPLPTSTIAGGPPGTPAGLVTFVGAVLQWRGAKLDDPAWRYTIPGDPYPGHLPWPGAFTLPP
jgi:hypothetical protein